MKNSLMVLLLLLLISCKSENFDNFPNYERVRTIELKLNDKAADALNNMSKILDGTDAKRDLNSTSAQSSEIFFKLTEDEQIFYIRRTNFRNYQFNDVSSYTDLKIPISELSVDNIELFFDSMPIYGGNYANVSIKSNFNNKDAFLECRTDIDKNGKSIVSEVYKKADIFFIVSQDNAIKFKKSLIIFLNNYKK